MINTISVIPEEKVFEKLILKPRNAESEKEGKEEEIEMRKIKENEMKIET